MTIHSLKLTAFFAEYDHNYSYEFCREIFGVTYCKTLADYGLYIWFGRGYTDFHTNLQIDKDSPTCFIKTDWVNKNPGTPPDGIKEVGHNMYIFLGYTEDEVIHKFTKCEKLKAFL